MGSLIDALERQGFHNAFAVIALPNDASVALFEAAGFRPAGILRSAGRKLGAWWDVGLWQRSLGDGTAQTPRTPAAIGLTRKWRIE